jgi:hypothetical protein
MDGQDMVYRLGIQNVHHSAYNSPPLVSLLRCANKQTKTQTKKKNIVGFFADFLSNLCSDTDDGGEVSPKRQKRTQLHGITTQMRVLVLHIH